MNAHLELALRHLARFLIAAVVASGLGACSLYQSDGRKFLEKQALQYSAASANVQGCSTDATGPEWNKISASDSALVLGHEATANRMRVIPTSAPDFHCDFQFASAEEMLERTDAAIELTLTETAFGIGHPSN